MYKFFVLAVTLACAQAGLVSPLGTATYAAAPAYGYATGGHGIISGAVGSSSQSTLRSYDGGSAISQYSKAVDTAFSSVRKSDTRITNDARYLAAAPVAYAAPAYAHAAPVAYAAPAVARVAAPVAYAAPAVAHAAPLAYAAHGAALAAPVARAGLLGVAYSAAPAVAHVTYDAPISHYAW